MITFLEGILVEKQPTRVVLNVHGVGYEIFIPLSSFDRLPSENTACRMLTHDHLREDLHNLYGFVTEAERSLFEMLLGISGIGPKTALSALSGLSVRDLKAAVVEGDVKRLSSISGVGKKTAERIVVELRDKVGVAGAWEASSAQRALSPSDQKLNDAVLALMALGFKQVEAHDSVRKVQNTLGPVATVEDLVRACLKKGA